MKDHDVSASENIWIIPDVFQNCVSCRGMRFEQSVLHLRPADFRRPIWPEESERSFRDGNRVTSRKWLNPQHQVRLDRWQKEMITPNDKWTSHFFHHQAASYCWGVIRSFLWKETGEEGDTQKPWLAETRMILVEAHQKFQIFKMTDGTTALKFTGVVLTEEVTYFHFSLSKKLNEWGELRT